MTIRQPGTTIAWRLSHLSEMLFLRADHTALDIVWWVNQELLHHGAEVALLRDLYGACATAGNDGTTLTRPSLAPSD